MAIGARITSENLSGKTATVTFTPYTGTTSGTTLNLGTKVIPFNNINTHPYGVYNLYLPEYDYTYTLTVDQPVTESQLFVHSNRMTTSNNYGVATLNFNDFTAEVIDLGIDSSYWYNSDILMLTDSGFGYFFVGNDDNDEKLVIFTDASNAIIGQYSGITSSYDFDTLEGKWITYEDANNGILKYSNGIDLHTYTWDPNTHYIDIENDYDSVMGDGSFIIRKYETGQWNYNGDGVSYIMKPDGTVIPFKTWVDGINVEHKITPFVDFIVVETRNQDTDEYTNLQIYNTDGDILETISLTGDTYISVDFTFLGTDRMCAVYYNWSNTAVDYKIIHYNGTTETLTETSHVRGSNYDSINLNGDESYWPNSRVDGSVVISFYNDVSYTNFGSVCNYFDYVYMLNNQTGFTTYSVANGTNRAVSSDGSLGNTHKSFCETTGNTFGLLTITTSGATITDFNEPTSGVTNTNYYTMGDRLLVSFSTNDGIDMFFYLIGNDGTILDSLDPTLISNYTFNINTVGDVLYLRYTDSSDTNHAYYAYSGSTGFTSTTYYNNNNTPNDYFTSTFLEPSNMVLWSEGGGSCIVLTNSGISSEITIPEYYYNSLSVGKDKFMMVYNESDGGVYTINLYNFTGTLLNTYTTEYNNWDDIYSAKDRFVVIFQGQGTKEFFLVSDETITSVIMDDYDGEQMINDYIWWDD
jgi:hypothetical protein